MSNIQLLSAYLNVPLKLECCKQLGALLPRGKQQSKIVSHLCAYLQYICFQFAPICYRFYPGFSRFFLNFSFKWLRTDYIEPKFLISQSIIDRQGNKVSHFLSSLFIPMSSTPFRCLFHQNLTIYIK